ncbi:MAG: hypothetical protein ABR575_00130 [Actinomycetota bacterium]
MSARPQAPDLADLGDLVVLLLASTLAGMRDRLARDGFERAADLVADLVEIINDDIMRTHGPYNGWEL